MEKTDRIAIANKIATATNGKVWTKDEIIRVYAGNKGYAIVDADGNVNIDGVNGNKFAQTKSVVEAMGLKAYRA